MTDGCGPVGKGGKEEVGGVKEREIVIRMYYAKKKTILNKNMSSLQKHSKYINLQLMQAYKHL